MPTKTGSLKGKLEVLLPLLYSLNYIENLWREKFKRIRD